MMSVPTVHSLEDKTSLPLSVKSQEVAIPLRSLSFALQDFFEWSQRPPGPQRAPGGIKFKGFFLLLTFPLSLSKYH